MNWKCKLFGHKWKFSKNGIVCDRCPAFLVKQIIFRGVPVLFSGLPMELINFRKHTIVPLITVQVAEAACREAKYYQTAKELRKCLTAEK